ncbi:segregation and condensation protein A [Streptomyces sp. NPDC059445]|uniref:segregation and condensation protein A n=1 Tax=Streptomyces sp. NPDC059445 TaxID=3346832 RepID=UPI0036982669
MTSNVPPPSAAPGGRRRALGRGPGPAPGPTEAPPEPSAPALEPSPAPPAEPAPAEPGPAPAPAPAPASPAEPAPAPVTEPEPAPGPAPGQAPADGHAPAPAAEPTPAPPVEAEPTPAPPVASGQASAAVSPSGTSPASATTPREPSQAPREGVGGTGGPGAPTGHSGSPEGPAEPAESPAEGSGAASDGPGDGVFKVRLSNFEGPFDLLLQLISKHKLDVTEVALSKVTDEFMAHIRAMGPDWDLDQTTEFLVVAATLLDLKAARLLPAAEVEDEADLALLEARDLLFARLLQYRAYKQIADIFNTRLEEEARRYPRTVGLEAQYAELLPEVVISIGPEGFARLAVKAMQPKPKPQVYVDHIHAPLVSVQEQAGIVVARLRELGEASFRSLVEDTDDTLTVVARFLALLELYREKAVALDQEEALGDLMVRWTGGEDDEGPRVTDEFDRPAETADDAAGRGTKKEKA